MSLHNKYIDTYNWTQCILKYITWWAKQGKIAQEICKLLDHCWLHHLLTLFERISKDVANVIFRGRQPESLPYITLFFVTFYTSENIYLTPYAVYISTYLLSIRLFSTPAAAAVLCLWIYYRYSKQVKYGLVSVVNTMLMNLSTMSTWLTLSSRSQEMCQLGSTNK